MTTAMTTGPEVAQSTERGLDEDRFCRRCGAALSPAPSAGQHRVCSRCGHVAYRDPKVVVGVVAGEGDRVLLVQRARPPQVGKWTFPSGYADAGEPLEEAAAREAHEEAGVAVHIEELLGVHSEAGRPIVLIVYSGHIMEGQPRPGPEVSAAGFFPTDELPELAFPHDIVFIHRWRQRKERNMLEPFNGKMPQVHPSAFVHEQATLIGEVIIGEESSVWPGAVLRADFGKIVVGRGTSVQDNVSVHAPGGVEIGNACTIGHNAVIHCRRIGDHCLIGMGAILLDGVEIGDRCIVAAGAVVTEGTKVPPGSMVVGVPGQVRPLRPDQLARLERNEVSYVELTRQYLAQRQHGKAS